MAKNMKAEPVTMVVRGRLAFVNVFQPRPSMNPGGNPKYSVCIMIPKDDPQVKRIRETQAKLLDTEFGPGSHKKPGFKTILRDGAEQEEKYPEFEGHMFMNASSDGKPGLVDKDNNPIVSKEDCYSGVDAFVQVNFYTYDNVSKGVSAGLNNIKVLRKLEAFSARQKPEAVAWPEAPDAETTEEADPLG